MGSHSSSTPHLGHCPAATALALPSAIVLVQSMPAPAPGREDGRTQGLPLGGGGGQLLLRCSEWPLLGSVWFCPTLFQVLRWSHWSPVYLPTRRRALHLHAPTPAARHGLAAHSAPATLTTQKPFLPGSVLSCLASVRPLLLTQPHRSFSRGIRKQRRGHPKAPGSAPHTAGSRRALGREGRTGGRTDEGQGVPAAPSP